MHVRPADEGNDQIAIRGLVEEHLGVARGDDLGAVLIGYAGHHLVDLALAEDLEVGVGLVQEEHRTGIRVHTGQQEQGLLQPPPGRGEIEADPALPVAEHDLAPFGNVTRRVELRPEQAADPLRQLPPLLGPLVMDPVAEMRRLASTSSPAGVGTGT